METNSRDQQNQDIIFPRGILKNKISDQKVKQVLKIKKGLTITRAILVAVAVALSSKHQQQQQR